MAVVLRAALCLVLWNCVQTFGIERPSENIVDGPNSEPGEPLYITPYLLKKQFAKARELSRTGPLPNSNTNVESYSGFFTVNGFYNSNMFFWFFPALKQDKKAPVILWLQGGPGNPGLFGAFVEHGPYVVNKDGTLSRRKYSWNTEFNVIYVDSPVGTGFSFTQSEKGYAKYEIDIANDLYEFLQQFFALFSEYRKNDFYIMGEAYGGKYVPTLGYQIFNASSSARINFKGIAIQNGLVDPPTMMDYGTVLFNLGLVDYNQMQEMKKESSEILSLIKKRQWEEALYEMDKLIIDFDVFDYPSLFQNYTGFSLYFNLLQSALPPDNLYYDKYVRQPSFRSAVHVGNVTYHDGTIVQKHLFQDIMQGMRQEVTASLNNFKVLFFNGQLDLIVPYALTVNFLRSLECSVCAEYRSAPRTIWKVDGDVAGYAHQAGDGRFTEVLVRNAGHRVAYDQPKAALELITRFVRGQPFD